jgi:hypothetical protein
MKKGKTTILVTLLLVLVPFTIGIISEATIIEKNVEKGNDKPYEGRLRVYIVEPRSRWDNYDHDPYHFGFLDFAVDEAISINYLDTYTKQITWDSLNAGYNVFENNIMAIAGVFNSEVNKGYSDPPLGNPFDAYYVDASAGATPGNTGYNTVNEDFTHTVLVEKATSTTCPYCPAMAEALYSVYNSNDYPFYFMSLISNKNPDARTYLSQTYNYRYVPTAYFDGGKEVLVGGYEEESYYRTRIESCGARDVHELDLSISVEWIDINIFEIEVIITNNEEILNFAPNIPDINGPKNGRYGKPLDYTFTTTDPDGDDVYYYVDWGDDNFEEWDGPYPSGEVVTLNHTWDEGDYIIRAKTKDIEGAESDWGTLEISMTKIRKINDISFRFLDLILRTLNNLLNLKYA